MKVRISGVEGGGDIERERLVLRVEEDTDIGNYTVLRCSSIERGTAQSGPVTDAYWFNAQDVKKGDFVVLYSKDGEPSKKSIGEDQTSYFFYWGLSSLIWTGAWTPVVLESPQWLILESDEATEEPNGAAESNG